jgi:hypothetical protein
MPRTRHPLECEDDTDAMKEAIAVLTEQRIRFARLTAYQLKSGTFSYYPDTETITEDGMPRTKRKGIDLFLKCVAHNVMSNTLVISMGG